MLLKKHYKKIIFIIGSLILLYPLVISIYEIITTDKDSVVFLENYHPLISLGLFDLYIMLFMAMLAYGLFWLFMRIRSILMLKKEQQQMELSHLQSQVNPHFFFNMLNNLYGLVDKDSKKAQALILKLSDMMRYSIYDGQKSSVTIAEEVEYLKNYIELHKMRYHKEIAIQFNTDIQDETAKVMPLLFIILLENAFKHGVENLHEHAFVNVNLIANQKEIHFTVENNFDAEAITDETGIGLKNLKRRLELVYPKKHSVSFTSENQVYKSQLTIQGS
ncbi:histidine kinase [Kordia sp. YSTF-M3]|uniref:Histidine kinase n=1 Tax=Kordia aestuariivivens TaxID=2759037 RepID=A0ABR7Q4Z4_9FLAO|nr:histidine kinase [Kordia aestuariivivens]MBC8753518.1 histidine kinase [Kordia aestuariivivens]